MLQVYEPSFDENDVEAVSNVLRSGWLNEHKLTGEFERQFAETVGANYAVATTSGTTALFLALRAAGVSDGSRVAVPDYVAIGTVRAIQLAGAWAILVDVNDEGNIDAEKAKQCDASHVIAVHNNGYPCDIDVLIEHFGEQYVIEDACQSIGSHYNTDKYLGTLTGLGCFSLATTKIITAGQGGIVVTDDEETYSYLQRMKNQGNYRGVDASDIYLSEGYNFKWTEMNAALALSQMSRLPQRVKRMREIVGVYNRYGGFPVPPLGVFPWRITAKVPSRKRGDVMGKMRKNDVNVQPFPKPMHLHYPIGEFPQAEKYASEGIYLPSSPNLSNDTIKYVCEVFKEATK